MNYITLYQFKRYKGLDLTDTTADDLLMDLIERASQNIDVLKGRFYEPRVQTRQFKIPGDSSSFFGVFDASLMTSSSREKPLRLDDDLLAVNELKNGDGSVIAASNYTLEPVGDWPKYAIRLVDENWYGSDEDRVEVSGIWGTHYRYDQAWVDSLDAIQDIGGITANATSMTVVDADGVAGDLKPVRFQPGQLIRIGTEFCLVISVSTLTQTVGLLRGYNGSTAAAHAQDTKIEIWRVMGNIVQACMRMVAWMYAQKDQDVYDRTYNVGSGIVTTPTALPVDVRALLGAPKTRIA